MPCPRRMSRGALTHRAEEHLGRRTVAVLLEEVVLDLPHVVVPETVGGLDLIEDLVEEHALAVDTPRVGAAGAR